MLIAATTAIALNPSFFFSILREVSPDFAQ
jgi:hypothetical protein